MSRSGSPVADVQAAAEGTRGDGGSLEIGAHDGFGGSQPTIILDRGDEPEPAKPYGNRSRPRLACRRNANRFMAPYAPVAKKSTIPRTAKRPERAHEGSGTAAAA